MPYNSTTSLEENAMKQKNTNADILGRFDEIKFELSKLKDSSKSVLKALSSLENSTSNSIKEINQKLSKVEAEVFREKEERRLKNAETRSNFLQNKKKIRKEYLDLKKAFTSLKRKFVNLQKESSKFKYLFKNYDASSLDINFLN